MAAPDAEFMALLRGVSRSFYLTLRFLPLPLRTPLSVGYLLARISDNVADEATAPVELRRAVLVLMRRAVTRRADADDLDELFRRLAAPALASGAAEYVLLRRYGDWLLMLDELPEAQGRILSNLLGTIIGGQIDDLEAPHFTTEAQTLAYCDTVAGCVGTAWTQLGYASMGAAFADPSAAALMEQAGLRYGRGLQLINILRDEEADAARGRCYLGGASRELWCDRAERYLRDGIDYARRLRSFRLRRVTLLPALLGLKTLRLLRRRAQTEPVKISRSAVYATLLCASLMALRPRR